MSCQLVPKQRLTFNNCKLLSVSVYSSKFRDKETLVYRQTFETPDYNGQLVYTGNRLAIRIGETRCIKATVKRFETFGIKFLRISRPILLDTKPAPLYDGLSEQDKGF